MKTFYTQHGIGKAKYVVSYHDGVKKYSDGGDFFDLVIFKNKKKLEVFLRDLRNSGYVERR